MCGTLWNQINRLYSIWIFFLTQLYLLISSFCFTSFKFPTLIFPYQDIQVFPKTLNFFFCALAPYLPGPNRLFYTCWNICVCVSPQLCPTLRNTMDCSLPGSFLLWIFQARILKWIAIPFSRGSFRPRDWTWSPTLQTDSLPSEPLLFLQIIIWSLSYLKYLVWGSTHSGRLCGFNQLSPLKAARKVGEIFMFFLKVLENYFYGDNVSKKKKNKQKTSGALYYFLVQGIFQLQNHCWVV